MPIISTKTLLSILISIVFLEKRNHIQISEKIMKTERKMNEVSISVVWCSDTESVNGSKDERNGLTALRYLNPGRLTIPLPRMPTTEPIMDIRTMAQFLIWFDWLLNFLMISHMITYRVANPTINPR